MTPVGSRRSAGSWMVLSASSSALGSTTGHHSHRVCTAGGTRGCDEPISLHEVPALAAAFGLDASSGTPQAQQQPQQQQPGAAGDDVAAENESEQEDRSEELSEEEEEPQYRLQVLAAAALFWRVVGP
uniref:Uncharacterized protein n=1 Tax=Tetradesmus obliquus TaxID=3088 RepID=A0A383WNQ3_TETOB|eukprot:jgi/Sobl393_1/18782/SZX79090.1